MFVMHVNPRCAYKCYIIGFGKLTLTIVCMVQSLCYPEVAEGLIRGLHTFEYTTNS